MIREGNGRVLLISALRILYIQAPVDTCTCTCMKAHLWFVSLSNSPNRQVEGNIPQCLYEPVYIYAFDNVCVQMYCTFCMHEVTYTVYGQESVLEKYI